MFRKTLGYISQDAFLKNNVIFFLGSGIVAFFNYLYHPVLSRLLSVEDFGEVQTIFSFVVLSAVVLSVFNMIAVNAVANKAPGENAAPLLSPLFTLALVIHLPFVLLLIVASPALSRFFSFESSWDFVPFALFLLVSVPLTFYNAYMQGTQRFSSLSTSQTIVAAGKLLFAIIFVLVGLRVFGAVSSLCAAAVMALAYLYFTSGHVRFSFTSGRALLAPLKKEVGYSLAVFSSLGLVMFLYSADVLVVKRLFDPETAGLYSGVATIARIIFFITASVSGVLLASVKYGQPDANRAALKKALVLVGGIGGGLLILFSLFPTVVISLLVGSKFTASAHLLPLLSFYLFLVSIVNLLTSYLLALRRTVITPIALSGLVLTTALLFLHHPTPTAVVIDFTIGTVITLILLTIFMKSP